MASHPNSRLRRLIIERAPELGENAAQLAETLDMSTEGICKWFRADRLSLGGARKLLAAAKGKLRKDDLLPYLPTL